MFYLIGYNNTIDPWKQRKLNFSSYFLDVRLAKAINWYRNNYTYIDSSNILYRLIEHLALPKDLDEKDIDTFIYNRSIKTGLALGLTSDLSLGRLHYCNFYGPNTTEVILLVDNKYKWKDIKDNWKDLIPVRVLRHDQTHISFNLLSKKNYTEKNGLAIIEVDINLLFLQYAAWLRNHREIKLINTEHKLPNLGYFLGQIVVPNMLPSHLNQVIINKYCMQTNDTIAQTIDYVGIRFVNNYLGNEKQVDLNIEDVHRRARMNNSSIKHYSNSIVGMFNTTALNFQDTPKILLNRQNRWAYTLAISRFLKHLLLSPQYPDTDVNKWYIERFKRENRSVQTNKVFYDSKIDSLLPYFVEEIEYLYRL